ncbi:MAG TPA: 50S ribosomal protein L9 [Gemmatimonadales bacterium]|jgi:large subunit ribosomal protein L9
MDVILRQDVDKVGNAGELVTVKDGFARNFLLPRGLAFLATDANRRRLEAERGQKGRKHAAEVQVSRDIAARLESVSLTFTMKAGEGDKLFGSVTASDVAERLKAEGFSVDKKTIELDEPLKALGVYKVPVRLHAEVKPEVRVWVVRE